MKINKTKPAWNRVVTILLHLNGIRPEFETKLGENLNSY